MIQISVGEAKSNSHICSQNHEIAELDKKEKLPSNGKEQFHFDIDISNKEIDRSIKLTTSYRQRNFEQRP